MHAIHAAKCVPIWWVDCEWVLREERLSINKKTSCFWTWTFLDSYSRMMGGKGLGYGMRIIASSVHMNKLSKYIYDNWHLLFGCQQIIASDGQRGRTEIIRVIVSGSLLVNPWFDIHEIGHKRWYRTFQHGCIPTNDVLFYDFGIVELIYHWKRKCCRSSSWSEWICLRKE